MKSTISTNFETGWVDPNVQQQLKRYYTLCVFDFFPLNQWWMTYLQNKKIQKLSDFVNHCKNVGEQYTFDYNDAPAPINGFQDCNDDDWQF